MLGLELKSYVCLDKHSIHMSYHPTLFLNFVFVFDSPQYLCQWWTWICTPSAYVSHLVGITGLYQNVWLTVSLVNLGIIFPIPCTLEQDTCLKFMVSSSSVSRVKIVILPMRRLVKDLKDRIEVEDAHGWDVKTILWIFVTMQLVVASRPAVPNRSCALLS